MLSSKRSDVLAIVLHYNRYDLTSECLDALRLQSHPVDVLVLDNGSTDDSPNRLLAHVHEPTERVQRCGSALGYAAAVNLGIRTAEDLRYQYVLLLGNDTAADSRMVEALRRPFEEPVPVGASGALQVDYGQPHRVYSAGGVLDTVRWTTSHLDIGTRVAESQKRGVHRVDYVDFAAALIPVEVIKKVGVLDERYRFYWEDVDWCWRCRKAGYDLVVCSEAVVRHRVSGTAGRGSDRVTYFALRNRLEAALKLRSVGFALRLAVGAVLLLINMKRRGQNGRIPFAALADFITRRPHRY